LVQFAAVPDAGERVSERLFLQFALSKQKGVAHFKPLGYILVDPNTRYGHALGVEDQLFSRFHITNPFDRVENAKPVLFAQPLLRCGSEDPAGFTEVIGMNCLLPEFRRDRRSLRDTVHRIHSRVPGKIVRCEVPLPHPDVPSLQGQSEPRRHGAQAVLVAFWISRNLERRDENQAVFRFFAYVRYGQGRLRSLLGPRSLHVTSFSLPALLSAAWKTPGNT
jgi:hypothetical protein